MSNPNNDIHNPAMAHWADYCDRLKQVGLQILRDDAPDDEVTRAEGWRYLTRLTRAGFEWFVEFADPAFPVFFLPSHETLKLGLDNPDSFYQKCQLSGRYDYRLRGKRNSIDYLSFTTSKGNFAATGTQIETGFIDGDDIDIDEDGNFEILISARRQPGNWLPMEAETESLLVRQNYGDRSREIPAELHIECLNAGDVPAPLTMDELLPKLELSLKFVENFANIFCNWAGGCRNSLNQLPSEDQTRNKDAGGDPNIHYYIGAWTLQEDEALVVEVDHLPECRNWSFQLGNHWMESLDYRYSTIHLNQDTTEVSPDGSVRMIVAHKDPGLPNWLSTTGHTNGTMGWRWFRADNPLRPSTRVVKFNELKDL